MTSTMTRMSGAVVAIGIMMCWDAPLRFFSHYDPWALEVAASNSKGARYDDFVDVNVETAREGSFLLVVSPRAGRHLDDEWLAGWLQNETSWLRTAFFKHGAVAFKGFDVKDPVSFERVALAVSSDLEQTYLGTSPRNLITGTKFVHTAAEFPPHRTIPAHLEMSFKDEPPRIQLFYGQLAKQPLGGESPLVDFGGVWESLSSQLRNKLLKTKVQYVRRYNDCTRPSLMVQTVDFLTTKCWQDMFKTSDTSEVLKQCADEQFECQWDSAGTLTITNLQPWVRNHEVTGLPVFFNHVNVLQPDSMIYGFERTAVIWGAPFGWYPMLMAWYFGARLAFMRLFLSEMELGHNVAFDGGIPLQAHELMAIKRAIWSNTVQKHWEPGDIVLVDNRRIGHGREMFAGPATSRMVLAAWSDNYPRW